MLKVAATVLLKLDKNSILKYNQNTIIDPGGIYITTQLCSCINDKFQHFKHSLHDMAVVLSCRRATLKLCLFTDSNLLCNYLL